MSNKILIVDDQAGIRLLLEEILKSEGYETISAKTGKQACELAEQHSIDLVIMDYNLPIMNGSEVLSYLDEIGFTAPVLIITGRSRESIEKAMEYPFVQEIILKPFDIHKLKEMVSGTLTHSS